MCEIRLGGPLKDYKQAETLVAEDQRLCRVGAEPGTDGGDLGVVGRKPHAVPIVRHPHLVVVGPRPQVRPLTRVRPLGNLRPAGLEPGPETCDVYAPRPR